MHVTIADNAPDAVAFLKDVIQSMGHTVAAFSDAGTLLDSLVHERCDMLIMDWHISGDGGLNVLQRMRSVVEHWPAVIFMAPRSAKKDIRDAFNAGADDYIAKPEDRAVITSRINALLNRNKTGAFDASATYGEYEFDRIAQTVLLEGRAIALTAKEFALADLFFRNADRTLSRDYIMETIWRTNAALVTRTLDMHISKVRSKLKLQPDNGFRIFTVFGFGYRLESMTRP